MKMKFMNKRTLKAAVAVLALGAFVGYRPQSGFAQTCADAVVYSTIYTSNQCQAVVEALAIKDGKYVYVGDKAGAAAWVDKNTKIIKHPKGMVMAGATEAHGHYVMQSLEKLFMPTNATSMDQLLAETRKYIAKNPDKEVYVGVGWNAESGILPDVNVDYAKAMDKLCADKPIVLIDRDHHQGIVNTKALELFFSGKNIELVAPDKGREDAASLTGGIILRLADGRANGYLRDQAIMYLSYELVHKSITEQELQFALKDMQTTLFSQGYTNYNDGFINHYGDKIFYLLLDKDRAGQVKVNVCPNFVLYGHDLQDDASIDRAVKKIEGYHRQTSKHILPAGIKLFVDGVTESQTGLIDAPYLGTRDNYGNLVTSEETLYQITKAANKKGIGIHTHSYGNMAVNYTVNAFIKAQKEVGNGTKNTMAHVRNVLATDYKRMAENNIAVAENISWHTPMTPELNKHFVEDVRIPEHLQQEAYPVSPFIKNKVVMASSTDAPATWGFPTDIFNIIEIAVNPKAVNWLAGLEQNEKKDYIKAGLTKGKVDKVKILNADQCVPLKTALDIMTINGAKFMQLEATRGSIEVGKYADFLLVNKNIMDGPVDKIHTAKIDKVYFEGQQVYDARK